MISFSGGCRNLANPSHFTVISLMSALLSMLIISALLLVVIGLVSKVTLGE